MEDKMIPLEVVSISTSFSKRNGYSLILKEIGGKRKIQMLVGAYEAQAIAITMENIVTSRPLTHHLIQSLMTEFELNLKYVLIYKFEEGIYYAQLIIEDSFGNTKTIDSRPSDAISLALRMDKPIMALNEVFDESEQVSLELQEVSKEAKLPMTLSEMSISQLQDALAEAIQNEAYEKAEDIKEEINKRKKT